MAQRTQSIVWDGLELRATFVPNLLVAYSFQSTAHSTSLCDGHEITRLLARSDVGVSLLINLYYVVGARREVKRCTDGAIYCSFVLRALPMKIRSG